MQRTLNRSGMKLLFIGCMITMTLCGCSGFKQSERDNPNKVDELVVGMHVTVSSDEDAMQVVDRMDELAQKGINLLVVEVGYSYQFQSHKELAASDGLSIEGASSMADKAKELEIELVPELDCLGHQSWEDSTSTLLSVYPQFDETIGLYPENEGIYCRSWCPLNEEVNPIIFDLMDELIEAFDAKAFHVGMDEVFLIGEDSCQRCRGKDKGELFAKAVNDYYNHLVKEKKVKMYLWGDRLLDGAALDDVYSEWDASYNDTYKAIDQIPKDIIIMDWHYDPLEEYPSIQYFVDHGFPVMTASYNDVDATKGFVQDTMRVRKNSNLVLGHIYTNWGDIDNTQLDKWTPFVETIELLDSNENNGR